MKHSLRLKIILACYSCYITGGFLSALFTMTGNRVASVLAVMIPTIIVGIYISLVVNQTGARKKPKPLPKRRASVVKPRNVKAVR